jgi:pimeloyl-ACP methyl ester carboxylesterase
MPADRVAWGERIVALLREGSAGLPAPPSARARDPLRRTDTATERCGYVDLPSGQMLLRKVGAGPHPPLLLLPESPGSSIGAMALARELARQGERAVFVADLPGLGGSDPLPTPDLASYAQVLQQAVRVLDCGPVDVLAEFTSTPLALQLARHAPSAVRSLVLDGVLLLPSAERRRLWKQYCPPVSPRWDGAHYLSWWHRLRDQELCWPWFDRGRDAIRRRVVDLGGERLTALTLDLARQPEHYGDAARAAFDVDAGPLLSAVTQPTLVLHDAADVRDRSAPKAARRLQAGRLLARDADPAARARAVLGFLGAPTA